MEDNFVIKTEARKTIKQRYAKGFKSFLFLCGAILAELFDVYMAYKFLSDYSDNGMLSGFWGFCIFSVLFINIFSAAISQALFSYNDVLEEKITQYNDKHHIWSYMSMFILGILYGMIFLVGVILFCIDTVLFPICIIPTIASTLRMYARFETLPFSKDELQSAGIDNAEDYVKFLNDYLYHIDYTYPICYHIMHDKLGEDIESRKKPKRNEATEKICYMVSDNIVNLILDHFANFKLSKNDKNIFSKASFKKYLEIIKKNPDDSNEYAEAKDQFINAVFYKVSKAILK